MTIDGGHAGKGDVLVAEADESDAALPSIIRKSPLSPTPKPIISTITARRKTIVRLLSIMFSMPKNRW